MRAFALAAITLVILTGFFHIMFIMFDYAYYNPDNGVFTILPEKMNETMNPIYQNITWNQTMMFREAFGVGRFVTLALGVVMFVIGAMDYVVTDRRNG